MSCIILSNHIKHNKYKITNFIKSNVNGGGTEFSNTFKFFFSQKMICFYNVFSACSTFGLKNCYDELMVQVHGWLFEKKVFTKENTKLKTAEHSSLRSESK